MDERWSDLRLATIDPKVMASTPAEFVSHQLPVAVRSITRALETALTVGTTQTLTTW